MLHDHQWTPDQFSGFECFAGLLTSMCYNIFIYKEDQRIHHSVTITTFIIHFVAFFILINKNVSAF
jgi:hypothetical membrane protein